MATGTRRQKKSTRTSTATSTSFLAVRRHPYSYEYVLYRMKWTVWDSTLPQLFAASTVVLYEYYGSTAKSMLGVNQVFEYFLFA